MIHTKKLNSKEEIRKSKMGGNSLMREANSRIEILKKDLQNGNRIMKNNKDLSVLAADIRIIAGEYTGNFNVPVFLIAKQLGIGVYKTRFNKNISGRIYAGGTTKDLYGNDAVILISSGDEIGHQRFVVAHEIAHYLLDYLPDKKYKDGKLFTEDYGMGTHSLEKELRADRFAAELLMPKKLFIEQYNKIINETNDRMFTIYYLSKYFKTKISSIEKRIKEVLA